MAKIEGGETLVVLVHGFTSNPEVWKQLLNFLEYDSDLSNYRFLSWGYPTEFDFGYLMRSHRRIWTDDPTITTIGQGLRTLLNEQARGAERLVLVGHSMGGLVIQAFIVEELLQDERRHLDRLTEVVLYGSHSGGLPIARLAAPLKKPDRRYQRFRDRLLQSCGMSGSGWLTIKGRTQSGWLVFA